MENYNNSVVAKDHSKIKNVSYIKNKIDKPSFWKGFFTGILSSLIASGIFYLIMKLVETNAA